MRPLDGKVALVTGATRGIGKGIALQLSENGCKVYITGRTLKSTNGNLGSLEETAEEIRKRGGIVVPVQCDHEKPEQIKELFDRIEKDEKGQLDILVNNAFKGLNTIISSLNHNFSQTQPSASSEDKNIRMKQAIFGNLNQKFWQSEPNSVWEDMNNVGLKNHYICAVYASRLMVPRRQGIIVNITSIGGKLYAPNVPIPYGMGKAALDRMSADCAIELKEHNIVSIGLLLGTVNTDITNNFLAGAAADSNSKQNVLPTEEFAEGESIEFGGKVLAKLAQDPNLMSFSGKIIIASDYALSNGIKDIDGRVIQNPFK